MATDPEIAERARTVARLLDGLDHFVEELEDRRSATGRRRGLPIRSAGPAAEHNSRKQRGSGASTPGGSITISARWSTATMSPQSVTTNSTSGRLMADNNTVTREFGRLMESFDLLLVPTIAVRVPRANGRYSLLGEEELDPGSSGSATPAVIRCRQRDRSPRSLPAGRFRPGRAADRGAV
jgi:hypothetical protein